MLELAGQLVESFQTKKVYGKDVKINGLEEDEQFDVCCQNDECDWSQWQRF